MKSCILLVVAHLGLIRPAAQQSPCGYNVVWNSQSTLKYVEMNFFVTGCSIKRSRIFFLYASTKRTTYLLYALAL
ncbi:MAG TPA: hypothetical protein VFP97_02205 [Chitinophagaceae bacterium]|nr:hypothetical protein [Chitinophagaceae bacterium]